VDRSGALIVAYDDRACPIGAAGMRIASIKP
jgi:hypothetical protein